MTQDPSPDELDDQARHSFESAGRWLARTFDLETIIDRRNALAHAEQWAARGLECERTAAKLRREFEQVSEND